LKLTKKIIISQHVKYNFDLSRHITEKIVKTQCQRYTLTQSIKQNKFFSYYLSCISKKQKEIIVTSMFINRDVNSLNNAFDIIKHRPLYVLTNWDWQLFMINEKMTLSQAISSSISVCK